MIKRQQRLERIRAVEREYLAARAAVRLLVGRLRADPAWGESEGWRARDGVNLSENIEGTYVLRLYAEFEAGLRDAWVHLVRDNHPPMRDLMVAMANQRIPQDWLDEADEVRAYRNSLVHEGDVADAMRISLVDVRSRLCRYFSRLPEDW
ncbi:MAG: hypothetical protein GXY83_34320 [Rhodopirellula sp.]|nr:hypothetical protein [Rhodopirellula sp.]